MRCAKSWMLQCFKKAQAYPEVCRAFFEVLERNVLVQIAGENRSSKYPDSEVRCASATSKRHRTSESGYRCQAPFQSCRARVARGRSDARTFLEAGVGLLARASSEGLADASLEPGQALDDLDADLEPAVVHER